MRITFLGTSAANAYPEAFCSCANCQAARALGGPSFRLRSSALINDDLIIDLGPDIHASAMVHGIDLSLVGYCLQTHAHADHLDASHLQSRSPGYGVVGAPRLHLYISEGSLRALNQQLARDLAPHSLGDAEVTESLNVQVHGIQAYQRVTVGPYQVDTLAANHDMVVDPLLYVITRQGQSLLYATDTAPLDAAAWAHLRSLRLSLNLAVFDHTYGPDERSSDHLCARDVAEYGIRLRREGILTPDGRVLATHIAHEGNPPHPQLSAYAAQHGYAVAYDGLVIDI